MTSVPEPPGDELTGTRDANERERRLALAALVTFGLFLAVAVPVVLFGLGSYHWFFRDDFLFLSGREASSFDDWFRPHNVHWSTVPVLVYRVLWAVFGFRSYVPYQACVLALHLSACVLLRVIMRRVGVGPWIATVAAATFVLFGPGEQNIIWAFQIGFTGSLTFGLAQLVLADHDGPLDKRDVLGVVAGALALLSSGVGIAMAVVAGLATLGRRGFKVALFHTLPLATMYIVWWLAERPELTSPLGRPSVHAVFDWVRSAEIGVFLALGHYQLVAALLAIAFLVGLPLAWLRLDRDALRRRASIPVAMLIGGVVFSTFSAMGRWFLGPDFARSSRYVHIGTALALPAVAVAVDAIARRRREVGVVAAALLLVAIPWNSTHFGRTSAFGAGYMASRKRIITNVVRLPEARQVPRDVRPIPDVYVGDGLTIGFLLDARKAGKLEPPTDPIPRDFENELRLRLGVAQRERGNPPAGCRLVRGTLDLSPPRGTVYGIKAPLTISTHDGARLTSRKIAFNPADGHTLTIDLAGLRLRFGPLRGGSFTLCSRSTKSR
jgi:hypothetical protein